jgi:hypothetical protein
VPLTIGAVASSGKATLIELQTVYSIEDVYTLMEINSIDSHNQRIAQKIKD